MAKARHVDGLHASLPFTEAAALTVRVRADELFAHAGGVLEIHAACFPPDALNAVLEDVKALADGLGARTFTGRRPARRAAWPTLGVTYA